MQHISPSRLRSGWLCGLPAKIRVVAKLAGLDEVGDGEEYAEKNADSCNGNIGNSEEGVPASHDGARADEDSLCSTIFGNVEVWAILDTVVGNRRKGKTETYDE
jgi:hypothetical protein